MEELVKFAKMFRRKTGIRACAHFNAANHYTKMNTLFGLPSAIIAVLVAAAVWATFAENVGWTEEQVTLMTGILATVGAVFTTTLAFFKYSENMEEHMKTAMSYDALKSEFELFLAMFRGKDETHYQEAIVELEKMMKKYTNINKERRKLTNRQYKTGEKRYDKLHREELPSDNKWWNIFK